MKQTLSLFLALLLLAGCAAKQPAPVEPEQTPSAAAAPVETAQTAVIDSSQAISAVVHLENVDWVDFASATDLYLNPSADGAAASSWTDYASATDLTGGYVSSDTDVYASATDLSGSDPVYASSTDLPEASAPAAETPIDYTKVYTDSSKYEPHTLQAKYTRLREGDMPEFVPAEGLGTVLPYVASDLFSGGVSSEGSTGDRCYGLMDAGGRLLTDGVYSDVRQLQYADPADPNGVAGIPFWRVTQLSEIWSEGEDSVPSGREVYGVVAMDGSFALPPAYYDIDAFSDGFVASGGEHRFEVYDNKGTLLFNGDALEEMDFPWDWSYGEDMFVLSKGYSAEYYFVDRGGKTVLGPYASADAFSDGLACVQAEENAKYGYIDRTGTWVIQPQFDDSARFQDGQAIQRRDGKFVVIDRTGAELISADSAGCELRRCAFGYEEVMYESETAEHDFYDLQGNVLVHAKQGELWQALDGSMIGLILDDGVELRSLHTPGWGLRVEGCPLSASPGVMMLDGRSVRGYLLQNHLDFDRTNCRYYFVTEDLTELRELEAGCFTSGARSTGTFDPVTGEPYSECVQGSQRYFYGQDGRLIGSCRTGTDAAVIGGMLRTVTDRACTYTGANGETVFCFPLLSILDA